MPVLIIEQISGREAGEISHMFPKPIADAGFRLHRLLLLYMTPSLKKQHILGVQYSPFLHYRLVSCLQKINIGKTGNQNPPDLKGQGGSGYLFFQY